LFAPHLRIFVFYISGEEGSEGLSVPVSMLSTDSDTILEEDAGQEEDGNGEEENNLIPVSAPSPVSEHEEDDEEEEEEDETAHVASVPTREATGWREVTVSGGE
jgi:hypothetical protein